VTFSFLVALGGCEPQVKGHVAANLHVGNDRARLIDVAFRIVTGRDQLLIAADCSPYKLASFIRHNNLLFRYFLAEKRPRNIVITIIVMHPCDQRFSPDNS
jgi:hypothetical protein